LQVARVHEVWLHARGVPGSHVVLRCEPGQDVDDSDMQFAADVAAYFSKAREVRTRK
jgi:predicted ribosome quality control (RQC) complex YloA/Tae2 family protein